MEKNKHLQGGGQTGPTTFFSNRNIHNRLRNVKIEKKLHNIKKYFVRPYMCYYIVLNSDGSYDGRIDCACVYIRGVPTKYNLHNI
jgi:hypothetical protein